MRLKLDEIASLTKAHLAIVGQVSANIGFGLETERTVEIVITGTYESVEQARVRLLVLLDELVSSSVFMLIRHLMRPDPFCLLSLVSILRYARSTTSCTISYLGESDASSRQYKKTRRQIFTFRLRFQACSVRRIWRCCRSKTQSSSQVSISAYNVPGTCCFRSRYTR